MWRAEEDSRGIWANPSFLSFEQKRSLNLSVWDLSRREYSGQTYAHRQFGYLSVMRPMQGACGQDMSGDYSGRTSIRPVSSEEAEKEMCCYWIRIFDISVMYRRLGQDRPENVFQGGRKRDINGLAQYFRDRKTRGSEEFLRRQKKHMMVLLLFSTPTGWFSEYVF